MGRIGSGLANRLHERKRLTIKIGYPLCTHAPVGTKCRGKKSFPFVHLPISEIGGRETSSDQGGSSTRFLLPPDNARPWENTIIVVRSTFPRAHLSDPSREVEYRKRHADCVTRSQLVTPRDFRYAVKKCCRFAKTNHRTFFFTVLSACRSHTILWRSSTCLFCQVLSAI